LSAKGLPRGRESNYSTQKKEKLLKIWERFLKKKTKKSYTKSVERENGLNGRGGGENQRTKVSKKGGVGKIGGIGEEFNGQGKSEKKKKNRKTVEGNPEGFRMRRL